MYLTFKVYVGIRYSKVPTSILCIIHYADFFIIINL